MTLAYIVLAYSIVGGVLLVYVWRLRRRLRQVEADTRGRAGPPAAAPLIAR